LRPGTADRLAPAGQRRRVGIEDDEQIAASLRRADVAAGREAGIAPRLHKTGRGRQLGYHLRSPVGGVVVDDDQLIAFGKLGKERG
jgi:hypothetical protein